MAGGRNEFGLTPQQEQYCVGRARGLTQSASAEAAGYSANNITRLEHDPKIRARVAQLKEENRARLALQKEAERRAVATEFEDGPVTLKWLMNEAREVLEQSKAEGRYKESIDALKFMAGLSGHIRTPNGADNDPNKMKLQLDEISSRPTVALQIVNNLDRTADHIARAFAQAEQPAALTDASGAGDGDGGERSLGTVEVLDFSAGEDGEPVYAAAPRPSR